MPLTSKINLEVGARTWRFNSGDPISGEIPKRGGYFETVPRAGRTKSKASSTVSSAACSTQPELKAEPPVEVALPEPGPSEEAVRIELEKRILAEEKLKIEEMNRQAQQTLEHAEMIRQQVTEAQELNAMAAEKEAQQRLAHQQAIEEEKQQMRFEADRKLQELREEAAVVKQKYEAELALWKERQERTLVLESEAEARAKAREAAEEARAQRERELIQERTDVLERLKQEAIEDYKRTHEELRRAQEQQLRKELEDARQKILEESAARKASLEAEREATLLKVKEEAQLEYQKQLDSHLQLGKETAEALKEASAKAAEEFKAQSQEAIKNLRSIAISSCPRSERSAPQKSSAGKTSSPNPTLDSKTSASNKVRRDRPADPQVQRSSSEEENLKKREAMRQRLLMGVFTPNAHRVHEWGLRSAPAPFPVAAPSPSTWGSPSNRQRANSVGQVNLSTPFIPGSALVSHLNPQQIAPLRGGYNHDLYSRSNTLHPSRADLYGNHSSARMPAIVHASPAPSAVPTNSQRDQWGASNNTHDNWGGSTKKHDPIKNAHQVLNKEVYKREQPSKVEQLPFQYTGGSKELYYPHSDFALPVTTMSTIRGYTVAAVYGFVSGVAIRNSTKELNENTLAEERERATLAMWQQAERIKGANFVLGLKFQNNPLSISLTEIVALGTAVRMEASGPNIVPNPDDQNAKPNALPSNKAGKGTKGTGVPAGGPQNAKNKNNGKRPDGRTVQASEDSVGNGGWDQPVVQAQTSDPVDESAENSQNEWGGGWEAESGQKKNGKKEDQQSGWSTGWDAKTDDAQKTKKGKNQNQGPKNEPAADPSTGWGGDWNQTSEGQDDNDNEVTNSDSWGGGHVTQKGQNGNKANKGAGGQSQKKGKQTRDSSEKQTSAPADNPTKQGKQQTNSQNQLDKPTRFAPDDYDPSTGAQFQVGYGRMNPGPNHMASSLSPNLPVVNSSQPWPHAGPPGHGYGDPRAMYHYRPGPGYEQDYWNRRGPGFDFHPMYHHYPPLPMPATVPSPQYPYGSSQRPPMQLEWREGDSGHGYQTRANVRDQNHDGDHHASKSPNKPSSNGWNSAAQPKTDHNAGWDSSNKQNSKSWGDSSNGENQASQTNLNKNPNAKGKGKAPNQSSKKAPPPPQDSNSWDNWAGNEGCSNDDKNEDTNDNQESQGGWNTSQGKKDGGKRATNSANQPQKGSQNQNGKSKSRMRSPPPASASSSPDNDETEDGDGLAMGIFNLMGF
ncbi:hypothetical protein PTTG_03278 [Puccinia triticina 1-1 BBBD Race 1]|uniref:Uncharacterized protein n=1 Tax=Puccinia triticina (isolate 1-1 / race 1 (BBBD)) TaxID=630390 RepID=A0A180GIF1_PUCT1|nr:hypothetical protein PTTG_03278 [Puccinia triticina 1-1 BBBD Race 1]WAR57205.1 hypothetical protein PtB15_8B252 [Puccinia triticina]